jgi:hypothetical protein
MIFGSSDKFAIETDRIPSGVESTCMTNIWLWLNNVKFGDGTGDFVENMISWLRWVESRKTGVRGFEWNMSPDEFANKACLYIFENDAIVFEKKRTQKLREKRFRRHLISPPACEPLQNLCILLVSYGRRVRLSCKSLDGTAWIHQVIDSDMFQSTIFEAVNQLSRRTP